MQPATSPGANFNIGRDIPHHEALNLSGRERVRDAFHIQTVNNRHSRLKDFSRRYRGVATKYLDNDLRWFQRLELEKASRSID